MNRFLKEILEFFLVLGGLIVVISFFSFIIMKKVSLDKIFQGIRKRGLFLGNLVSSIIGAVTPFCVCTTIPVFVGMLQMGISTDVAMSFLFSSPLLNFSAAVLIAYLFGFKFAVYFTFAVLLFSTAGGMFVHYLQLGSKIKETIINEENSLNSNSKVNYKEAATFSVRLLKSLLIPLLIGAVIAGFIHNYVPIKMILAINKLPVWLLIPLMALVGFPIYSNILSIAPICFSLVEKGMNQGAVVTFMISSAGISLPTAILLNKILKKELFVYYLFYTFIAYCMIGIIFNFVK